MEKITKDKYGFATLTFTVNYKYCFDKYVEDIILFAKEYNITDRVKLQDWVEDWLLDEITENLNYEVSSEIPRTLIEETAKAILSQANIEEDE